MSEEIDRKPVFSVRIDIKSLAPIAKLFAQQKAGPGLLNRNELISDVINAFHDLIIKQGLATPALSYEEALATLESVGITFTKGTPAHRAVVDLLQKEHVQLDHLASPDEQEAELRRIAEDFMRGMGINPEDTQ